MSLMKARSTLAFFALLLLLSLACQTLANVPLSPPTAIPTQPPGAPPQYHLPPDATPTPTPFWPAPSTQIPFTPTPALTPSWGKYPGPSVPSDVPIPPPADLIAQPPGQVNILLLGSDQRTTDSSFRTDTILLVTLNPNLGSASVTSFPRDLYVYIPGWTMQRINTAFQKGGFDLLAATFEYNFGVLPDHYVMVNFRGFKQGIDSLGGIDVQVARPFDDGYESVPAGLVHMNGDWALWYVRSRVTTNDFDRTRRQQEVLLAVFYKLISLDAIRRAPELFNLYRDYVVTDMTLGDATPLLGLAGQLGVNPDQIHSYYISPKQVTSYRVPSTGAQVLLPKYDEIEKVMRSALNASD